MRYRALGKSGISISEIGFGAWGIGGATPGATSYGVTRDEVSLRALHAARDHGITFFDTSSVYGYGHSEKLIGKAFRAAREQIVIATKAGLERYGAPPNFTPIALRRSLEASLCRLGSDYVDLFLLHNAPQELAVAPSEILMLIDELRRSGKIRAFGVSVRVPEEGLLFAERWRPDAIQTNLNMLDHRAIDCGLLECAEKNGIGVVARTPLCFGFLGGRLSADTVFGPQDHRSQWSRDQRDRWLVGGASVIDAVSKADQQSAAEVALRFCLSYRAVSSVIPGMLDSREVEENARASDRGPLSATELRSVRRVFEGLDLFPEGTARPPDPGKLEISQ